jgi:hypothetical protein
MRYMNSTEFRIIISQCEGPRLIASTVSGKGSRKKSTAPEPKQDD